MNGTEIFDELTDGFKEDFIDACTERTYEPLETIVAQGEAVSGMFIVAHGSVEITSVNAEGQTVLIHLHQRGETFGETEALADRAAAANCSAAGKAVMLVAQKSQLLGALQQPFFVRNLFRVTYGRLVRDNATKFVDQFYTVEQRLRDYLYRLSVDKPEISKTQADLAGLLGCARQTLNRELGRLRDRSIIEMEKGKIRVTDRPALLKQVTATLR